MKGLTKSMPLQVTFPLDRVLKVRCPVCLYVLRLDLVRLVRFCGPGNRLLSVDKLSLARRLGLP